MHPLVRGAAAAAILTALGSLDRGAPPPLPGAAPRAEVKGVDRLPAPCLPGTLPEGPVCVRIPGDQEASRTRLALGALGPAPSRGTIEQTSIPRRPERPADPAAYLYPVGGRERTPRILGGFDRAPTPEPGVHLAARPGERVVALVLERQQGPTTVAFAGEIFGPTVVTRHVLDQAGRAQTYLLLHGGLERAAMGIVPGVTLQPGAVLGFARPDNGGALVEIYLEARLLREGAALDDNKPTDPSAALPIDVRDVLPLREAPP